MEMIKITENELCPFRFGELIAQFDLSIFYEKHLLYERHKNVTC
ncbi:hypothetical protein [Alkalihalobacillus sp. 1P02AB]